MSIPNPSISNLSLLPSDGTAANPSIAIGGSLLTNQQSGTGIYGDPTSINMSILGTLRLSISASLLKIPALSVANSASATTPGTVVKKIEVFDAAGISLGFLAVYNAIT